MKELDINQVSLIQQYARYAPEFHIVGERKGRPVVRLRDSPVLRIDGEVKAVPQERFFVIGWAGKCGDLLEEGDWDEIDPTPLPPVQQAFINDYTEALV